MANRWVRDRAGWFYYGFGLVALASALIGFSTTYFMPLARRSFDAPFVVHIHGLLCFLWVLFFIGQSMLVRAGRSKLHRQIGQAGVPIALGILVSGMGTALWATERDLQTVPTAFASTTGTLTSLSIFSAFVIFAIAMRRRPDWHKRLMMLATVVVLWPAFFRFRHLLPSVPRPEIWLALILADLPILIAALRDRLVYGRVHPVWAVFGTLLILEQSLEIILFETTFWRELGRVVYGALT